MTGRPALVIVGPAQHGVVIVARQVAADLAVLAAVDGAGGGMGGPPVVSAPTLEDLLARDPVSALGSATVAHVHFTDQLFGPTCAIAADGYDAFARWAARGAAATSVTLHDLPDPGDDPSRYERRRVAYARVVRATTGPVVVSSDHEADLLTTALTGVIPAAPARPSVVIALAIGPPGPSGPRPRPDGEVAILGFVYPGKGHALALHALALDTLAPDALAPDALALDALAPDALAPDFLAPDGRPGPTDLGLTALGRTADGHDDLTTQLRRTAAVRGVRFTLTGYLPDAELTERLRRATVPLVAHERISASGSIGTWLAAGRRPLVPDGPYARELAARCPGAVTLYEPVVAGLRRALARALRDPDSTWLGDVLLAPTRSEVAEGYRAALTGAATRRVTTGASRA